MERISGTESQTKEEWVLNLLGKKKRLCSLSVFFSLFFKGQQCNHLHFLLSYETLHFLQDTCLKCIQSFLLSPSTQSAIFYFSFFRCCHKNNHIVYQGILKIFRKEKEKRERQLLFLKTVLSCVGCQRVNKMQIFWGENWNCFWNVVVLCCKKMDV